MSDYGDAIDEVRAELADAAGDFMPDTCTVKDGGTPTSNGDGTTSITPNVIAAGVPCKYKPLSVHGQTQAEALGAIADHSLTLPFYFDGDLLQIGTSYTIEVDARDSSAAKTFKVVGPLDSSNSLMQRVAALLYVPADE